MQSALSVKEENIAMASTTEQDKEKPTLKQLELKEAKGAMTQQSLVPPPPPNNTPCNSISAKTCSQVMSLLDLKSSNKDTTTSTITCTTEERSQSRLQSIFLPDSAVRLPSVPKPGENDSFRLESSSQSSHTGQVQDENADLFPSTNYGNRKRRASSSSSSRYKIAVDHPSSEPDSLRQSRLREIQVQLRSLHCQNHQE